MDIDVVLHRWLRPEQVVDLGELAARRLPTKKSWTGTGLQLLSGRATAEEETFVLQGV